MERRQRAAAFARLLKGTQAEPADFHLDNENSRRAEIEWGASTLIVQLLLRAVQAPGRAAVPSMFEDTANVPELVEAFASLKNKLLISDVFGRIGLNSGAWSIARSRDATSVSASELEVLRMLAAVPEPARRISRADVERARESHSGMYPLAPDLTRLVGLGVLRADGADGFFVSLDGEILGWRETTLRAAAILWECGPRGDRSDVDWLREWIDRVAMIDWSDAPRAMTHGGRARFLDAATVAILQEPALICSWQREQLRLRLAENHEARPEQSETPGTGPSSPLDRYRHYQELFRNPWNAHRGHEEIVKLLGAVIRWDPGSGDVVEPGKRIVELLRAGSERPFLSHWVPWLVLHAGAAGIAWCLLHDDLAALGCGLILELEIAEESTWIDGMERIQRGMEQRLSLWEVGMRVMFAEATHGRTQGIALAIAKILQIATKASMIRILLDSNHAAEEQRGLESILDRTLYAIREARCSQVVNPGAGLASFRPKLLPHIARPMFAQIASAQDPEKHGSVCFPLATMRLLARLLEVMEEARLAAPEVRTIPTNHEIAMAIMTRYCGEFGRDLAVDNSDTERVVHVFDEPGLASLPWGAIALALADSPELASLLRPVEFRERIRAIPATAARVFARNRDVPRSIHPRPQPPTTASLQADLTQAWANKLRLHLRVLLAAHEQLRQIKAPDALSDALEGEILEVIHSQRQDDIAAGALQVFRRLGSLTWTSGGSPLRRQRRSTGSPLRFARRRTYPGSTHSKIWVY